MKIKNIYDIILNDTLGENINTDISFISEDGKALYLYFWNGDGYSLRLERVVTGNKDPEQAKFISKMKKLADLSIEELRNLKDIKQPVASTSTGQIGKILSVSESKENNRAGYVIDILWDDGSSIKNIWHNWLTHIVVFENK